MSLCTNSIRALSRHQPSPKPRSLLPFLYQTATIQQWNRKPASHLNACRGYASSRFRNREDQEFHDVPFEGSKLVAPGLDKTELARTRKSTMTNTERAAFEKLYKGVKRDNEKEGEEEYMAADHDRIFDEYAEEDEDDGSGDGTDLDSVFDAVLSGSLPSAGRKAFRSKPVENLETLAKRILHSGVDDVKKKSRAVLLKEATRIREIRRKEKERVVWLLGSAQTDREIWEVLQKEVFDMIRKLNLDADDGSKDSPAWKKKYRDRKAKKATAVPSAPTGTIFDSLHANDAAATVPESSTTTTTDQRSTPPPNTDTEIDPRILFPNYPSLLVDAVNLLRKHFPASLIPYSILPTIKSLGRSSYALGATTSLYNHLIRTAWIQHASYSYIDELLTDMDNGGILFDAQTLQLLDKILAEFEQTQKGRFGGVVKVVWGMEQFVEGAKKLEGWREIVRERLGAWGSRRAQEGTLVREWSESKSSVADLPRPRDELREAAVTHVSSRRQLRPEEDEEGLILGWESRDV